MLKSLVLAGIISTAIVPADVAITNGQPTPDPKSVAEAVVAIDYEDADKQINLAHTLGVHKNSGPYTDLFYVDDYFEGVDKLYTKVGYKTWFDSEEITIREIGGSSLLRTYPESKDQLITSRLTDFASKGGDSVDKWGSGEFSMTGVLNPSTNTYKYDYAPYPSGSWANRAQWSNEFSGAFLGGGSSNLEITILDKMHGVSPNNDHINVQYQSTFYYDPNTGKVSGTPTSTQENHLNLTTIYS